MCTEDVSEGGPEAERRPEVSGWGTDISTGQDAYRGTIASDLCLLQRVRAGAAIQPSAVLFLPSWLCPCYFSTSFHVVAAVF